MSFTEILLSPTESVFKNQNLIEFKPLVTSTPDWQQLAQPNWIQNRDSDYEQSEISLHVSNKNQKATDQSLCSTNIKNSVPMLLASQSSDEVIFVKESPARVCSPKSKIKEQRKNKMIEAIQQANSQQATPVKVKQNKNNADLNIKQSSIKSVKTDSKPDVKPL